MADFTLSAGRFLAGDTVTVYAADAFGRATGDAITSGTVATDGTLALSGLAEGSYYVASDGMASVRFLVPVPVQQSAQGDGDALTSLGGAIGEPVEAAPFQARAQLAYPAGHPAVRQPDTLFILDVRDEQDVLERGGWMSEALTTYFAADTDKAELVAGPFFRQGVGEKTTDAGTMLIPANGLVGTDQGEITFRVLCKGAEGSTLTGKLLAIVSSDNTYGLEVYKSSATTITARWTIAGVAQTAATITGLTTGDLSADAWTIVSVSQNGTSLTIRIGNNAKSATATMGQVPPRWAAVWIAPLTDLSFTTHSGSFAIAELTIGATAMTPGATGATYVRTPAIVIDAGTPDGSVNLVDMAGVFLQYPGWRDTLADGQTGGSGPGQTGTAIRDAAMAAVLDAGIRLGRIDHIFDKVTVTGSGATVSVSDWSALDEPMDMWHAGGGKFHITLDYTPAVLGATTATPPTSTAGFAKLCSDACTHWKAKGYTFFLALWNEPASDGFWSGTSSELADLWLAVQAQLATDHPDIEFGGADEHPVDADLPAAAIVVAAAENDVPLPFVGWHAYEDSSFFLHAATQKAIDGILADNGLTGTPKRVGEWAVDNGRISFYGNIANSTDFRSLMGHPTAGVDYAAAALERIVELLDGGAISAIFTRLAILDTSFTGNEQLYGLFTHDDPPRPLPVFGVFQAMAKATGQRVTASTTFAPLRALAALDDDGTITIVYGSNRAWDPDDVIHFAFQIAGLPDTYSWEMYRMDRRDADQVASDGRLRLIGKGGVDDPLPLGTNLTAQGIGCLRVTPGTPTAPTAPSFSVAPTITGTGVVGSTLACDGGTCTGTAPIAKTYQWQRAGLNITGATASTYQLVSDDIGDAVTCAVTATNGQGSATGTSNAITATAPTAPGQVTGLSLTPGDAQIAASWTAPASNGGSTITTYLVEYRTPAGSGSYTTFTHGASTTPSITITGLTDGDQYEVRVSAVNAIGTGTPSSTQTATPTAPSNFVNDTFTGSDGTLLSAHTGETGATWAKKSGNTGDFKILGNAIFVFSSTSLLLASGTPAAADYDVVAVMDALDNAGGAGFGGRWSASAETGYLVQLEGSFLHLYAAVAGVYTQIGTTGSTGIVGETFTVRLRMRGTAIEVDLDTGSGFATEISATDGLITTKGFVAVRGFSDGDGTTGGVNLLSIVGTDA